MITTNPEITAVESGTFFTKKLLISAAILIIFHAVGFWGLLFSGQPEYFQELTPLNLLLTNFLLLLNHKKFDRAFFTFAFTTFSIGFLAEVLGVKTGFPFGHYSYGQALGFKLFDVPVIIGLNWFMLVYAAGSLAARLRIPVFLKAIAGALFMVFLDFFIEPAAMKFDFWTWHNYVIPWYNYVGWLFLALGFQLHFQLLNIFKNNALAPVVYFVQVVFFVGLYTFG